MIIDVDADDVVKLLKKTDKKKYNLDA